MNSDAIANASAPPDSVPDLMRAIGRDARAASLVLAAADTDQKNRALKAAAAALRARRHQILAANEQDLREAAAKGLSPALLDRLKLTEPRIEAMARGIEDI